MKKYILLAVGTLISGGHVTMAQTFDSVDDLGDLTEGLVYTEGTFHTTHSEMGTMQNHEEPAPTAEELMDGYRNAENKAEYFAGLPSVQQASAWGAAAAEEKTAILAEQNWIKRPGWYYQPVLVCAAGNGTEVPGAREAFHAFVLNLSAEEVAGVLGHMGHTKIGFGYANWEGVDLSAYDGFAGTYLSGANFAGAVGLTAEQVINHNTYLVGANFAGTGITQEMADFVIAEKDLSDQVWNFRNVTWDTVAP